jgi:rubrerythrin
MGFTRRIEDFTCAQCGRAVKGTGYTNHCPACLWGKHVDVEPGDRAEPCGGMMEPVAARIREGEFEIAHRCILCGFLRANRSAPDDDRAARLAIGNRPWPIEKK